MSLRPVYVYWVGRDGITQRSVEPVDAQPLVVGLPCVAGCQGHVDSIDFMARRYSCTSNGRTYHPNPERISQVADGELVIRSSDGREIERVKGKPLKRSSAGGWL